MSKSPSDWVLDRVRKLLSLANGTDSQEEAATALEKAHSLLQENNLALQDVEQAEIHISGCEVHELTLSAAEVQTWENTLCTAFINHFEVRVLQTYGWTECHLKSGRTKFAMRAKLQVIGIQPDVSIAVHVFEYLSTIIKKASQSPKGSQEKRAWRNGFAYCVSDRLSEYIRRTPQTVEQTALVLAKESVIQNFIDHTYPTVRATMIHGPRRYQPSSFFEGMKAGREVSLNMPVERTTNLELQQGQPARN